LETLGGVAVTTKRCFLKQGLFVGALTLTRKQFAQLLAPSVAIPLTLS